MLEPKSQKPFNGNKAFSISDWIQSRYVLYDCIRAGNVFSSTILLSRKANTRIERVINSGSPTMRSFATCCRFSLILRLFESTEDQIQRHWSLSRWPFITELKHSKFALFNSIYCREMFCLLVNTWFGAHNDTNPIWISNKISEKYHQAIAEKTTQELNNKSPSFVLMTFHQDLAEYRVEEKNHIKISLTSIKRLVKNLRENVIYLPYFGLTLVI